jgi:hypothetical protein
VLKLIYETILHTAYALFIVGITISMATDATIRVNFSNYIGRTSSAVFIIVMVVMAAISYSLGKAYNKSEPYAPNTKRAINLIDDCLKGALFVVMIVFITGFVNENSSQNQIVIAYWIYIASMVFFTLLHLIKWIYYLCWTGKDNLKPWSPMVVTIDFTSPELVAAMVAMNTKGEGCEDKPREEGKKGLPNVRDYLPSSLDQYASMATDNQLNINRIQGWIR